jgi:hypothetical protein
MIGKESGARIAFASTGIYSTNNSGTTEDASYTLGASSSRFTDLYLSGGLRGDTTFKNNAGTTEYARFDSSGNLLVGTTTILAAESNVEGISLAAGSYGGLLSVSRDGNRAATFNRKTSDGEIVQFRKDGTTVGSIGVASTGFYINGNSATSGLEFATNTIVPSKNASRIDAALNLGMSTNRFKDLYLSGTAYVGDRISHDGDSNTYVGFTSDSVNLFAGGVSANFTPNGFFINDGSLREDYDALSGTSPTCNVNTAAAFSLSMSGNTTFTFTSPASGYSTGFVLQLTGNGSTVTWPSSVDWAGGTAPDAPASGETDLLVFWTRDGGTTWYGALAIDAAA